MAAKEKARADHVVLAKEIKRLRGELAAAQQVRGLSPIALLLLALL